MGTDIHWRVEKRTAEGWVRAEPLIKNDWFDKFDGEPEFKHEEIFSDRNYSLFAMLADVRNGYGFAGVDRGDPVTPIDEPRGLPDDVSEALREECEDYGHTPSWFTLAELVAVPWHDNQITLRGWVGPKSLHRFDKWGTLPDSWSGSVSGENVRHVSNDEMRQLIEDGTVDKKVEEQWGDGTLSYYTQLEWTIPWVDAIGDFPATLIRMTKFAADDGLGLDDVRAVFWFDS
ncbi:hypothetical protein [Amycolatopsis kentuckyensis]|uniref:hypothetical protein n=1 Tax=Amycolatopsis kentuckyensis TaxID=218823 RepID=UPI000A3CA3DD|nr:hypothetical protein [Amycolatopsis kentuckyensis]